MVQLDHSSKTRLPIAQDSWREKGYVVGDWSERQCHVGETRTSLRANKGLEPSRELRRNPPLIHFARGPESLQRFPTTNAPTQYTILEQRGMDSARHRVWIRS